jgi:pimeloyl-ACP methyl ester carboxylesterase
MLTTLGCLAKQPERLARPEVSVAPWTEKRVVSPSTGETYNYLFLSGPSAEAPAMLLLPGGFFDNRIWLYFQNLASHCNLYALDWPDTSPLYRGRVEDMGEIAADFLATIAVKELHVVGVSAGAYPAVELATNHKELRVDSVILISSIMFGVSKKEIRKRKMSSRFVLRLRPDTMRATAERIAMRNEYEHAPGAVQQKDIFWVRPYTYYHQIFEMTLNQGDRRQKTDEVVVPVLFFHGTEDEIMDYDIAKENPTLFSKAEFITIDGGLHSMVFSKGPEISDMIVAHHVKKGLFH